MGKAILTNMNLMQPASASNLSLRFLAAPKLDNILVPVDFSAASIRGVQAALTLLRGNPKASLTLVHVIEPVSAIDAVEAGVLPSSVEEQLRESAEERLALLKLKFGENIRVTTRVMTGNPIWMLSAVANPEEFDLITMTSHGRSGLKRAFLGSVAEGVIHRAHCSVLVVKLPDHGSAPADEDAVTWSKILVGYDHRFGSVAALGYAGRIAEATHASISLMHALPPPEIRHAYSILPGDAGRETYVPDEVARLEAVRHSYFPLSADWNVAAAIGEPWDVLSENAREAHSDLIVVGPHHHVLRARDFIGSTAQRLVRLAPCSVLAVK